jgi:hypothetical protein
LSKRTCGSCTACCTVNGIVELGKPIRTRCQYECSKGCAIYGSHPESCKDYACLWLKGFGTAKQRPDKIGLFIEKRDGGPPLGVQLFAKELRIGAFFNEAREYLVWLNKKTGDPIYRVDETLRAVDHRVG